MTSAPQKLELQVLGSHPKPPLPRLTSCVTPASFCFLIKKEKIVQTSQTVGFDPKDRIKQFAWSHSLVLCLTPSKHPANGICCRYFQCLQSWADSQCLMWFLVLLLTEQHPAICISCTDRRLQLGSDVAVLLRLQGAESLEGGNF